MNRWGLTRLSRNPFRTIAKSSFNGKRGGASLLGPLSPTALQTLDRFRHLVDTFVQVIDAVMEFAKMPVDLVDHLGWHRAWFGAIPTQIAFNVGRFAGKSLGQLAHANSGQILCRHTEMFHSAFQFLAFIRLWTT